MTLKHSFTKVGKLFAHDCKYYWWLILLNFLVFLFTGPVALLMYISSRTQRNSYYYENEQLAKFIANFLLSGGTMMFFYLVAMLMATIMGFVMFAYLHNKRQINFYHSLPISRSKLFTQRYLFGLLVPVIMVWLMLLLDTIIALTNGVAANIIIKEIFYHGGRIFLFCWLTYSVAVLAGQLTGTVLTHLCMMTLLYFGPLAVYLCSISFFNVFNATMVAFGAEGTNMFPFSTLTYLIYYWEGISQTPSLNYLPPMGLKAIVVFLLLSLLTTAVAHVVYQKRPSESAGLSVVYRPLELIIKWVVMYIVATVSSMVFLDGVGKGFALFALIVFPILTHMCAEIIFRKDFKAILNHWQGCLLFLAVMLIYTGTLYADVYHYDSYLPDKEKVANVSLEIGYSGDEKISFTDQAEIEAVLALVEKITTDQLYTKNYRLYDNNTSVNNINFEVDYTLTNGRQVLRRYNGVDAAKIVAEYENFYNLTQWEYRILESRLDNSQNVSFVSIHGQQPYESFLNDPRYTYTDKRIELDNQKNAETLNKLSDSLLKDLAQRQFTILGDNPLYRIQMELLRNENNGRKYYYQSVNIYENDIQTLSLINELASEGLWKEETMSVEQFAQAFDKIEVYQVEDKLLNADGYIDDGNYLDNLTGFPIIDDWAAKGNAHLLTTLTDTDEIAAVLEAAVLENEGYLGPFAFIDNRYYAIGTLKEEAVEDYDASKNSLNLLVACYFLKGHLPAGLF